MPFLSLHLEYFILQQKNNILHTINQAFSYYSYRNLVLKKPSKTGPVTSYRDMTNSLFCSKFTLTYSWYILYMFA